MIPDKGLFKMISHLKFRGRRNSHQQKGLGRLRAEG